MDKRNLYIQKIIVFLLIIIAGSYLAPNLKYYFLLPILFFTLAFLISKITGEKPDYLFKLSKSDEFLNKKAGFWVLFKWVLILFGLVYDIIAWTIFGVYLFFNFILDILLLFKTVLFWIVYGILWFLNLFVPPIVFLFKIFIHYVFKWIWWIYRISFINIRKSLNLNFYYISLWGSVLMIFTLLLFYGVGILIGLPELGFVGAVFSLLPLVWSYGEISALRLRGAENDSYSSVKNYFQSGFHAVRAVLGYFIIFLFLLLTELVFNLLGWIPQVGFSFMGLAININSIASLLLLFVLVILVFAKLIMAPHVVYNQDFRSNIDGSINFLGTIGKRFLRYTLSSIPTIFFGFIVIIIPALIVGLSILLTYNIKNTILDTRIDLLNDRLTVLEGVDYYKASKDIEALKLYKAYPFNFVNEFSGLKSLTKEIQHLDANIKKGEEEINRLSMEYYAASDSLDKKIERTRVAAMADSSLTGELNNLQDQRISRQESFKTWTDESNLGVGKMKVDMSQRKGMRIQLPIVFLLTIIWASLFLGIVLAFIVSYLGNVYFELYNYREDGTPSYFCQLLTDIREKDKNQPLLGFTLLFLLGPIVIYFTVILNFITGLLS